MAGHGRLMDPPARNAMWRLSFNNPVNYNDNELYCGGFVSKYNASGANEKIKILLYDHSFQELSQL